MGCARELVYKLGGDRAFHSHQAALPPDASSWASHCSSRLTTQSVVAREEEACLQAMGSGRAIGWQRQVLGYWVVVVVVLQYSSSERLRCGAVRPLVASSLVRNSQLPEAHHNTGASVLQGTVTTTPSLETESSEFLRYVFATCIGSNFMCCICG